MYYDSDVILRDEWGYVQWTGHLTPLSISLTTSTFSPTTIEYTLFSVSLDAYTRFGWVGDFSSHVADGGAGESDILTSEGVDEVGVVEGVKEYSSKVGLWPDRSNLYILLSDASCEMSKRRSSMNRAMDSGCHLRRRRVLTVILVEGGGGWRLLSAVK
jgi:hypothetical protein